MKNWFIGLALLIPSLLKAECIEVDSIEKVFPHVEKDAIVLLGMTDTLIDSSLSVGSKPWRQYIRRQIRPFQNLEKAGNLQDQWTYVVSLSVPIKPVQPEIVQWIDKLQQEEVSVFCLTGRGRNIWYSTIVPNIDKLTDFQLKSIGIDFTKTKVPEALKKVDPQLFYNGIFYTDPYDKGEFVDKIIEETGYTPKKIIVVDDKWASLKSLDEKLTEEGIPHVCVLYQRAEKDRKDFNPLLASVQLEAILENGTLLTDEQAAEKAKTIENTSADEYFKKLVMKYGNLN